MTSKPHFAWWTNTYLGLQGQLGKHRKGVGDNINDDEKKLFYSVTISFKYLHVSM